MQLHFFCTDLGLTDMFLTNQNAEIVACILLVLKYLQPEKGEPLVNYRGKSPKLVQSIIKGTTYWSVCK